MYFTSKTLSCLRIYLADMHRRVANGLWLLHNPEIQIILATGRCTNLHCSIDSKWVSVYIYFYIYELAPLSLLNLHYFYVRNDVHVICK